jgi:glycosyltransferase involved in cell wall biosynthesis
MRILIVHNHYGDYAQGGEANVMEAEARLLSEHGHTVVKYERANAEIEKGGILVKANVARNVVWSESAYDAIHSVILKFRPDLMHVHNYWLLLTPAIFSAAKRNGVATVLTLHNYRLVCPGGQFLRDNKPCELCLGGRPWRVLAYRCYPGGSMLKSCLSLRLYIETRKRKYLASLVDAYIALSDFGRNKFVQGGLPGERIYVKPNFMDDPCRESQVPPPGKGAIFVGRISPEKGFGTLIKAWQGLNYPLTVVGGGPLAERGRRLASVSVRFTGQIPQNDAIELCRQAALFVFPSECYEGFPLSLLEAMALGRAIVASDLGSRREMIEHGVSGLLFEAGNATDLREKVMTLIENPGLRTSLGNAARRVYQDRYTAESNYEMLIDIYNRAIKNKEEQSRETT